MTSRKTRTPTSRRSGNMAVRRTPAARTTRNSGSRNPPWIVLAAATLVAVLVFFVLNGAAATHTPASPDQQSLVLEPAPFDQSTPVPAVTLDSTPFFPTPQPSPTLRPTIARPAGPYVGIVAGHWGNDSGAVCPDGITEQQVNLEIAKKVTEQLRARGVWVDLLQEFDPRLEGFQADVLVSIHADSCDPIDADPPATGFKVAGSAGSQIPTITGKLVDCLRTEYQKATSLDFHENSITRDMTSYHSFREIDPNTPAAIIETGFLHLDYDMIVRQPDRPATGIANGILCFLKTQL
jgi:N-acetylmuramoyl-L-alanine amidase